VISVDAVASPTAAGKVPAAFEKERGVTSVTVKGPYAHLVLALPASNPPADQLLPVYAALNEADISINLVKLHPGSVSFVVEAPHLQRSLDLLAGLGHTLSCTGSVDMVSVYAAGMRSLSGVMARISRALLRAQVPIIQTGDGPDTVFCLVPSGLRDTAVDTLRAEFNLAPPPPAIVVQKFGGRSVGTAEARRLACERVREAIDAGYRPVVVVSAIGRMGEPYATDTLLSHLHAVDPNVEPTPRECDMLMACGEMISTVIFAQTLKSIGLRAIALTGEQAGILTDDHYGDAQILHIDASRIHEAFAGGQLDVVVVAGFQGVTEGGAITTLGRGGSDTTASALGAALRAEKIEIYTHVDGVMTADPEVCPSAHTLAMVTFEEVCNMAHQGAKVIHPRAAEIAMQHQIPLWVKTSFERKPGTLVAPLTAQQAPTTRKVTGIATLSKLVYFTLLGLDRPGRAEFEALVHEAVGAAGINFYLNSIGPETSSFIVEESRAQRTRDLLHSLEARFVSVPNCEMVSVVALNMWEVPGFLYQIANTLAGKGIQVLQMADSECSVSCLVDRGQAGLAVKALHDDFELGH
jgi:aspartate kinase